MSINSKTKAAVDTLLTDDATTETQFKTGLQDVTTELDLAQSKLTGGTPVTGINIDSGAIDNATVGAVTPSTGAFTTLNATGGGSLTGTWSDLGSVTTVDINGGSIDGAAIGAVSPSTGAFTTLTKGGSDVATLDDATALAIALG